MSREESPDSATVPGVDADRLGGAGPDHVTGAGSDPVPDADRVPGAGPVREEDAFDVCALDAWVRDRVDLPPGLPEVRQFLGGASNLTFLVRYPGRDLVMRRPPAGQKASGAHDMHREFEVQRRLAPVYQQVPAVIGHCEDETVLGSQFYVMSHVPGLILRGDLPEGLTLSEQEAHDLGLGMVDALADLHSVDVHGTGLADFWRGWGYVARQVDGWSGRYRAARTDDVPDAEDLMTWLAAHQPEDCGARLIHGDWRLDNLVLDPDDLALVRAVLDWEMSTVGDPLMDLGAALAYWVQADDDAVFQMFRRQPSNLPGMPTRAEIVDHYLQRTGISLPQQGWLFYEVYGLFRLAVIVAQIWYRYRAGQTSNPAFAGFGAAATYLVSRAEALIAAPNPPPQPAPGSGHPRPT